MSILHNNSFYQLAKLLVNKLIEAGMGHLVVVCNPFKEEGKNEIYHGVIGDSTPKANEDFCVEFATMALANIATCVGQYEKLYRHVQHGFKSVDRTTTPKHIQMLIDLATGNVVTVSLTDVTPVTLQPPPVYKVVTVKGSASNLTELTQITEFLLDNYPSLSNYFKPVEEDGLLTLPPRHDPAFVALVEKAYEVLGCEPGDYEANCEFVINEVSFNSYKILDVSDDYSDTGTEEIIVSDQDFITIGGAEPLTICEFDREAIETFVHYNHLHTDYEYRIVKRKPGMDVSIDDIVAVEKLVGWELNPYRSEPESDEFDAEGTLCIFFRRPKTVDEEVRYDIFADKYAVYKVTPVVQEHILEAILAKNETTISKEDFHHISISQFLMHASNGRVYTYVSGHDMLSGRVLLEFSISETDGLAQYAFQTRVDDKLEEVITFLHVLSTLYRERNNRFAKTFFPTTVNAPDESGISV